MAKTKIDVDDGTMSMKFGDITAKFNIFDVMKHPIEDDSVFQIDLISELVDETYYELFSTDFQSLSDFDDTYTCDACIDTHFCSVCAEIKVTLHVDITSNSSIDTPLCTVLTGPLSNLLRQAQGINTL